MFTNLHQERGFTLIEILIVIAILAVLATVVVLALNPAELFRGARDATRASDLNNINKALALVEVSGPSISFGSTNTVYISIPDSSATCTNLTLPSLPSGWSYACATSANYRLVDGNGWIPVDFESLGVGSPLPALPIDPVNTDASGLYYIYIVGSWKLTAVFESQTHASQLVSDGGPDISLLEIGSDLSLANFARGLNGLWSFEEGSGSTINDSSGSGNDGTAINTPTWSTGVDGGALDFNGTNEYVKITNLMSDVADNNFTASIWFYSDDANQTNRGLITKRKTFGSGNNEFSLQTGGSNGVLSASADGVTDMQNISYTSSQWNHFVLTIDRTGGVARAYLNGSEVGNDTSLNSPSGAGNSVGITIGAFNWNNVGGSGITGYFNGKIDDARLYKKALSGEEVSALYNAGQS